MLLELVNVASLTKNIFNRGCMSDSLANSSFLIPNWPAPKNVRAFSSTRLGGHSVAPYDSLNLGAHVGDDPATVEKNRQHFAKLTQMPNTLRWLKQVHGTCVAELPVKELPIEKLPAKEKVDIEADAAYSSAKGVVCAVMTADCLPVLFCNTKGTKVAASHAGWRGLCDGVIEQTLTHFSPEDEILVWLGPAIGAKKFEVGEDVRNAFLAQDEAAELAFTEITEQTKIAEQKWLADLYLLARQRLEKAGIEHIYGGNHCTYEEHDRFFSYRRDKQTGRMASVIWLEE